MDPPVTPMADDDDTKERNPYHDDSGQFTTEYSVEGAVEALRSLGGQGGTSEVGEAMGGAARRTAYNYLRDAEDRGLVKSREVGASKLWLLTEEGENADA